MRRWKVGALVGLAALAAWPCIDLALAFEKVLAVPAARGRVTDADGRPVAGARVKVTTEWCGTAPWWQRFKHDAVRRLATDLTDAQGWFVVRPGDAHLVVEAAGFAPWHRAQLEPAPLEVRLTRPPTERFEVGGTVLNPQGAPARGVEVTVSDRRLATWPWHQTQLCPVHFLSARALTDEAGRFRVEAVPPGDYVVSAVDHDAHHSDEVAVQPPATALTLRFE